jgi:hypothetical protein
VSGPIPVFVNDHPLALPPGATAAEAVAAFDPTLAERLAAGSATLTDARGIAMGADQPLFPGAIVRVIVSARRSSPEASDAHP